MPNPAMPEPSRSVDEAVRAARSARDSQTSVADNFQTAVDRSLKDQPLTTLALAIAVGFVLGAVWKA
jgi:ElaB/YqjD/DUF883 family membrane-anchored ribosome-binding protein